MCTINDNHNDVWFLWYWAQQTKFFVILDNFLPFYPPKNQKNQNFEKMKKTAGDIIILHKCTINTNHMMYHSWDMTGFELVKQNLFTKISECSEEKNPLQANNVLDLQITLWKMQRVLTKFCKVIWLSFANEILSLFNKIMGLLEAHKI